MVPHLILVARMLRGGYADVAMSFKVRLASAHGHTKWLILIEDSFMVPKIREELIV
jgi:hypothetical protein